MDSGVAGGFNFIFSLVHASLILSIGRCVILSIFIIEYGFFSDFGVALKLKLS
jgi:hypothetical protein